MKILYLVHQYFPRSIGGTEIYTHGLAARAQAAGHEVLALTTHESASGHREDFHIETTTFENIPIVEVHFNLSLMPHPARAEYFNAVIGDIVAEQIRAFQPDVVHALHSMKISAAALEACYEMRVPVVITLCDFWFLCPRHTLLKFNGSLCSGPNRFFKCVPCVQQQHDFARFPKRPRQVLPFLRDVQAINSRPRALQNVLLKAQRIIALSHFAKEMFVENGFPKERIEVLAHGLETEDLDAAGVLHAPRANRNEPLKIGFIGSLVPHKGAHVLLEALASIPDARVELLVYGALPESEYGHNLKAAAAHDSRVRLMGGFERHAIAGVLRSFDVLAMPALWYENQPLVIKAAHHMGIPVLASAIGSLPEMIEEGVSGWLVAPSTPTAWAAKIAGLAVQQRPVCQPQKVKTMDENAAEMLKIYEQVSCYDVTL